MVARTSNSQERHELPAALAEVALVDDKTSASVGLMSKSWWLREVRAGRAPAPAIREPRCTRWRLSEVRAYWAERAAKQGGTKLETQDFLVARAKKASDAAQAKRRQKTADAGVA